MQDGGWFIVPLFETTPKQDQPGKRTDPVAIGVTKQNDDQDNKAVKNQPKIVPATNNQTSEQVKRVAAITGGTIVTGLVVRAVPVVIEAVGAFLAEYG